MSEEANEDRETKPYAESPIIMTTVRVVSPFVLTYGIFVTLHGADSPGGGFQGGVIMASVFVMLGFAFGIRPTSDWADYRAVLGLATGGVVLFAAVGLIALPLGGDVLQLDVLPIAVKWGVELLEVAIGMIVAGVVTGLFFVLSRGGRKEGEET